MNVYHAKSRLLWLAAIGFTLDLAGCDMEPSRQHLWNAKAALAIAEAEQPAPIDEENVASPRSGRGTNSRDLIKNEPVERDRRLLYFGATFCPACRVAEASLERLAEAGWQVGPEPDNHIQTFTIGQTENEQLVARQWKINAVPTWVLWENGEELERRTGPLDPFEIGRLFGQE